MRRGPRRLELGRGSFYYKEGLASQRRRSHLCRCKHLPAWLISDAVAFHQPQPTQGHGVNARNRWRLGAGTREGEGDFKNKKKRGKRKRALGKIISLQTFWLSHKKRKGACATPKLEPGSICRPRHTLHKRVDARGTGSRDADVHGSTCHHQSLSHSQRATGRGGGFYQVYYELHICTFIHSNLEILNPTVMSNDAPSNFKQVTRS